MDCFSCKQQFNDKERCPRLLINCGHSICESCLVQKLQNKLIICPECSSQNYADSINSLPKNIALLNVKRQTNITVSVVKNSPIKKSHNQVEEYDPSDQSDNNCPKHLKKYEGNLEFRLYSFVYNIQQSKVLMQNLNSIIHNQHLLLQTQQYSK